MARQVLRSGVAVRIGQGIGRKRNAHFKSLVMTFIGVDETVRELLVLQLAILTGLYSVALRRSD